MVRIRVNSVKFSNSKDVVPISSHRTIELALLNE
jgi:hypothetical protein